MCSNTKMNNMETLQFNGTNIRVDEHERINMTDLWKSSGKSDNYKPYRWMIKEGSEFINAVTKKLKGTHSPLLEVTRGRTGTTFGHKQIALAYAKYLSPELHMYVNQVFFERLEEEANPELGITRSRDRAVKSWTRKGKSEQSCGKHRSNDVYSIRFIGKSKIGLMFFEIT